MNELTKPARPKRRRPVPKVKGETDVTEAPAVHRASWLTPAFAWQVITFVIVQIVAAIIAFQFLASDVRSSREEQARMAEDMQAVAEDVKAIRGALPSPEVLNMRFKALEDKLDRLRQDFDFEAAKTQKYKEDLTRDLIKKGVID